MYKTVLFLLGFFTLFSVSTTHANEKKYGIDIVWYGHAVTTLYDGTTRILIDPFFTGNSTSPITWEEVPKVDYILITHDHADHIGDVIALAKKYNAKVSGVVETMVALEQAGLPKELVLNGIGFNLGGTIELGGFKALMIPAVHTSASGVPVGYIITSKTGFRTYHAGDTAPFEDMKMWASLFPLNLAMIPIGGFFTEDAILAVHSLKLLRPKYVLPIHYKTFPVLAQNTEEFKKALLKAKLPTTLLDVKPGQVIKF